MVKKVRIITFGVFDPLHEGHSDLFGQAKKMGDSLLVVVARDSWVRAVKKREPSVGEQERLRMVREQPSVDEARLGYEWPADDEYGLLKELKFSVLALGYDQSPDEEKVKTELRKRGKDNVQVVRLKPYKPGKYKSSLLR